MSRKKGPRSDLASRIINLAQRAIVESADDTPETNRLLTLVAHTLDSGANGPVLMAVERLEAQEKFDLPDFMHVIVEEVTTSLDVSLKAEFSLFVVPLLVAFDDTRPPPSELPGDLLTPLARSFRAHGLVGAAPSVYLLPYLYPLQDLPETWVKRRSFLRQLLAVSNGDPASFPKPTPWRTGA